jgi:hypothetical protein
MKMAMNVSSTHPLEAADDPDKDEYFYSIKKRIYQSAKEGFSLNLQVLISRVESTEIRNVLVNQASQTQVYVRMENFPNHHRPRKRAIFPEKSRDFLSTRLFAIGSETLTRFFCILRMLGSALIARVSV